MTMQTVKPLFYAFGLLLMLVSCHQPTVYKKQFDIPNQVWTYQDSLKFEWTIQDTQTAYNLELELGHDQNVPYSNVYVLCHTIYPDKTEFTQPVSLDILDKHGRSNGRCSGRICKCIIPLQTQAHFPVQGNYSLSFTQYSRTDSFPGLHYLALNINPAQQKN